MSSLVNFMGLDFGTKRIGVAVGQIVTATARPEGVVLTPVVGQEKSWQGLDKCIADWQPDAFVLGLPLAKDGTSQPLTELTQVFADQVNERYAKRVFLMDERFSSQAACDLMREACAPKSSRGNQRFKRKQQQVNKDSLAAVIILESWFRLNPKVEVK